jgi:hypothetical protein
MLDSLDKMASWRPLLAAALCFGSAGCLEDAPLPELGECAALPGDVGGFRLADGTSTYEYGQVGVGRCLASPTDLRVVADPADPSNHYLLVLNANARANFEGSSLLAIDASSIDLSCPSQGMHELRSNALGMQEFAARMDFDSDTGLGLVTARVFGGEDGALNDVVFAVDASDPSALAFADSAPNEFGPYSFVSVPADPWSVRINPWNRTAYVLSLTEHTVNGIDLSTDPVQFLDLVPDWQIGDAVFDDADGSGSAPDFQLLGFQSSLIRDEELTITWQEGVTRLLYPALDADGLWSLHQSDAADGRAFVPLAGGPVLEPGGGWSQGGLGSAAVAPDGAIMAGFVAGEGADGAWSIGWMQSEQNALDWALASQPAVEPTASWQGDRVADPAWYRAEGDVAHLWYAGGPGPGRAIGHAEGLPPAALTPAGDAALPDGADGVVLAPSDAGFDSVAVFAPAVRKTALPDEYRLYYTGHADAAAGPGDVPQGMGIGLALSSRPDGGFERTDRGIGGTAQVLAPGSAGDWDALGVASPSIVREAGRWYLYYQGWDGTDWRLGRAVSLDGFAFDKDPANPLGPGVTGPDGLPLRAFVVRPVPGGYYRLAGSLTGALPDSVFEGVDYESPSSPVLVRVVGGQALGRGEPGSPHEDGASAAASAVAGGPVVYVAHRGSRRRLAVADDRGAGLSHRATVELAGFGGGLSDLNAADPERSILGVEAAPGPSGTVVALGLEGGIAVAGGDLAADAPVLTALSGGLAVAPAGGAVFDGTSVSAPSLVLDAPDGVWRLYYEGRNEDTSAIGLATSTDQGATWTRQEQPVFERGAAGTWDDDRVRSPSVVFDAAAGVWHLWYRGSDGAHENLGHATSEDGVQWVRSVDASGATAPVWDGAGVDFADTIDRVQVRPTAGGYQLWFDATLDGTVRIGRAESPDGLGWALKPNPTTHGDAFRFTTRRGDLDPASGIFLGDGGRDPVIVDGIAVSGAGASEMVLSPDGRWAVVANKRNQFLTVLDLFDDSRDGYIDANYLGVEAAIFVPQARGMVGMRAMQFSEDGATLWVTLSPLVVPTAGGSIADGTEGLIRIDFSRITDAAEGRTWLDGIITGFLPAARGVEEDRGYETDTSVGPGGLAVNRAGTRAYITNFNDNSLYVLDVARGARGAVIDVIRGLDETPFEIALSPDERLAYIGNSYGIQRGGAQHSTIQVVDIDEASPTYGEVLTRLDNLGSRSSCE